MSNLVTLLAGLASYRQFIVYRLERADDGYLQKFPIDPNTGRMYPKDSGAAMNPAHWVTLSEALAWSTVHGANCGAGIVISADHPIGDKHLFCVDIDNARSGESWLPHVQAFMGRFPGAFMEVSASGSGVHIMGLYSGPRPVHGVDNRDFTTQLYTGSRFIALTGKDAVGDVLTDHTAALASFAYQFFPPKRAGDVDGKLRDTPVEEWRGPTDDAELLQRMMRSNSASGVFGGRARFADLWNRNMEVLPLIFPPKMHGKEYDYSGVDQALANHLAWWSGNHGTRMEHLMRASALVRSKWDDRPTYLTDTILEACAAQKTWYSAGEGRPRSENRSAESNPLTVSDRIPGRPDLPPPPPPDDTPAAAPEPTPIVRDGPAPPPPDDGEADREQFIKLFPPGAYLDLHAQIDAFKGMTYVRDMRAVYLPFSGVTVGKEVMDDVYGGRLYGTSVDGQKPTDSAWNAFVRSPLFDFPKADGLIFDPTGVPGAIVERDNLKFANTWIRIPIKRTDGDVTPFLNHVRKILPYGQDADLLLWYMAAIVQNPGVKAQWCPFLQGVEGNGKTIISRLMEYCVGQRYTHWPQAAQLGNHFNAAFYGKLLICVEDVFVPEARGELFEVLKPMITATRLEITPKGVDPATRDVCFNFILNSNHKNGIRKTRNDRRLMPLFCAQQAEEDLERDGMGLDYFRPLRRWVLDQGGPIVAGYLTRLDIPREWNFAVDCLRPPKTSATAEAIGAGLGAIEQEIIETVMQNREGFRGGWISSYALDNLLVSIGRSRGISRDLRRTMLTNLGYSLHPSLDDGRAEAVIEGVRPQLYIKRGATELAAIPRGSVAAAFVQAQR